jgi:DNA-binding transcriptional MerR regulator
VSQRQLNHWIARGILTPSKIWQSDAGAKPMFVFTFKELALLRVIARFREAGIPLPRIAGAVEKARKSVRSVSDDTYLHLATDGRRIYQLIDDAKAVVDLTKKQAGQLVFATVALGPIWEHVRVQLASGRFKPIPDAAPLQSGRTRLIG